MAFRLQVPDIGEGLTEAEIVRWLVEPGDAVAANDPLLEVETDKAVVEIPSPRAGVLLHQGAGPGVVLKVGELLAVIGTEGERWEEIEPTHSSGDAVLVPEMPFTEPTAASSVKAMPIMRRMARDLGVDLAAVAATGPGGKITREDIQRAAHESSPEASQRVTAAGDEEGKTLSALRRTIARNLSQSWAEIPHVTVWRPANATRLLAARLETGFSLEALLIKVVLPVLAEFPDCNATFDGASLHRSDAAHIGVAVDTVAGLMVPVVRNAETMNLNELDREITRLSSGAQSRSLGLGELSGGTFTVSNVGAVGGGYGTPIIPYGTTSIVSIGRAEDDVVVRDGAIAVAPVFPVSLSFDHRVVDGAMASRFLRMYCDHLESYGIGR